MCSKFTGEHPCRRAILKLLCNFIEIALQRTPLDGFLYQNLMHNSVSLVSTSKNNRNLIENYKNSEQLKIGTYMYVFQDLRVNLNACNENYL